jgi:hypothetical protein
LLERQGYPKNNYMVLSLRLLCSCVSIVFFALSDIFINGAYKDCEERFRDVANFVYFKRT